jgi:hypothetical protein
MADFGDDDPEDAYDESDPAELRVVILARMLVHVAVERSRPAHDHTRTLVRIGFAIAAIQRIRMLRIAHLENVLTALLLGFLLLQLEEGA